MATSITQYGITWTFDGDYTTGQYVNGDYYVVAPSGLTITEILPASTLTAGRTVNGSMVNPTAGGGVKQGFDSSTSYPTYDSTLNAARPSGNDLSAGNPLVLAAGSSLVSTKSKASAAQLPQLDDAAVLTVVASAPAANSFRPPYCGTDKTHNWVKGDLDYSIFRSLSSVANTPALSTVEGYLARPWIEINTSWTGRYIHPTNNQPDYGRDMAAQLSAVLLSLHLDYSNAEKETALIRLCQYAIDIYGAAVSGGSWDNDGGHNLGRKPVLLVAAMALGDSSMLAYANADTHFIFQEDQQTWVVTESDVGRTLYTADGRPREQYIEADVGIPEWGEKHTGAPERDGRNYNAYYRDVCSTQFIGHRLAIGLIPSAKTNWNWDVWFDYSDRFWTWYFDQGGDSYGANDIPAFSQSMWNAYWGLWAVPTAPTFLTATATGSSAIALSWTDNASDETGYVVERSPNGTTGWTVIATLAADSESYTDSGLLGSTAYHYRVKAYNAYGSSAYSDVATDTTDAAPVLIAGIAIGQNAMAFL